MDQQQVHLVPNLLQYPLFDQLIQWDGVEGEPNDEENTVGDDGDDLSLSKPHVFWQGEVPRCVYKAW